MSGAPHRQHPPDPERELLRRIERCPGQRAGYKQLVREMGLGGGRERRLLLEQLARLTARNQLVKIDKEHWGIPKAVISAATGGARRSTRDNLAAGKLDLHRDGYGFVRPNTAPSGAQQDDIFVPPNEINGAMQGDQVLVEVAPPRGDGRRMGRIIRVLNRKNPTVVGIFHYAQGHRSAGHDSRYPQREPGNYVVPMDERMTQPILIPPGEELIAEAQLSTADSAVGSLAPVLNPHRVLGIEATAARATWDDLEGLVVDVEVTDWPTMGRPARGRVIEVLGPQEGFGVDVEIVIRKHHLPHVFPANVLAEAAEVAVLPEESVLFAGNRRRDFCALPIVTIDGETARDFDDAVHVLKHADNSWSLQVHIADVAEYVTEGSALDLEARLRGNSVYFPDRAIPMLPPELSTNICSLRPNEDRLVTSCLMEIAPDGEINGFEVCEGVIRSANRMTYTQVHQVIDPETPDHLAARTQFASQVEHFDRMYQLARILNAKRERRGSIDFDLPEPIIEFDELGAMQGVVRSQRNWANRLIEEFMLSANECVASWIEHLGIPGIYRIHEKPEPRKVVEFEDTAASFGVSLGLPSLPVKKFQTRSERRDSHGRGQNPRTHEVPEDIPVTPRMYQRLAAKISGRPEERILAHLMLRSLKQAKYSEKNEGHFALATPSYTHFTSPIRRYPDLIVHRLIKQMLADGADPHGQISAAPWGFKSAAPRKHRHGDEILSETEDGPIPATELEAIADESSQNERRAAEAERELIEWKKIKFMQDRVGEDFEAMILSITKYGMFVELDGMFVEGLVLLNSLAGDHFTFRENTRQIIGARTSRRYSMGDRVRVILDRIDKPQRRLQFSILEDLIPPPAPKKPTTKKKAAKMTDSESIPEGNTPAPETSTPAPRRKSLTPKQYGEKLIKDGKAKRGGKNKGKSKSSAAKRSRKR